MKKIISVLMFVLLLAMGCTTRTDRVSSIVFSKSPKSTYLVSEIQSEGIEVEVLINYKSGDQDVVTMLVNESGHDILLGTTKLPFKVSGYGEDVGKYTLKIELEGYRIVYQYRVVEYIDEELFEGGNGTEESPFLIKNAQQLSNIRFHDGSTYHYYELINDIDLSGFDWRSIGKVKYEPTDDGYTKITVESGFYGSLDGNGYSIKNYTVVGDVSQENASYTTLFCGSMAKDDDHTLMSEFKNLTLENVNINVKNVDTYRAAILFGTAHNIRFDNIHINGNVVIDNTELVNLTFGAFGSLSSNAQYHNCSTDVTLFVKGNTNLYGYGAYVGWEFGKSGNIFKIVDSTTNSKVILLDTSKINVYGSFVGYIYEAANHEYKNLINYQPELITSHDSTKNFTFNNEVYIESYEFSPVMDNNDRNTVVQAIKDVKILGRYGGGGNWGGSMLLENCYGYKSYEEN